MNKTLVILFCSIMILACKTDKVEIKAADLVGFWEIAEAKRNGKKTSLLDGGYFYFSKTGSMATNIKGDTISANYVLEGSKIKMDGIDPMIFQVNYILGDTINLSSKIGSSNFDFLGIKPEMIIK